MKQNGKKLETLATADAYVPRPGAEPLRLKIRAVPFGFADRLREEIPAPRPLRVKKGGSRAGEDARVLFDDPNYIKQVLKHNARLNALVIHHALGADKNLSFDAIEGDSLVDFADEILDELGEAGFTEGDIGILADQVDILSNNAAGQVEEARNRFLSEVLEGPEDAKGDGSSPTITE